MMGVSHLLASWWLRSQGRPSNAALETFLHGYLLMAAWYLVSKTLVRQGADNQLAFERIHGD
jgi:hypothetical protein